MKTRKLNANSSRVHDITIAGAAIGVPVSRRAHLMGASALGGGARGLVIAAGMMTVLGAAPAFAQCSSDAAGTLSGGGACAADIAAGANSTAIGLTANATGANATAYGNGAVANGDNATATGAGSLANCLRDRDGRVQ
jgi:trimeric autotransporter adhesin